MIYLFMETKSEYLIISSTDLNYQEVILKSRYFLIPLGGDLYKFGANYDRKSLNNQPTIRNARSFKNRI